MTDQALDTKIDRTKQGFQETLDKPWVAPVIAKAEEWKEERRKYLGKTFYLPVGAVTETMPVDPGEQWTIITNAPYKLGRRTENGVEWQKITTRALPIEGTDDGFAGQPVLAMGLKPGTHIEFRLQ